MAAPIPQNEPFEITAGDTLSFQRSFNYYPASDGWALTYVFLGPVNVNVTATTSSDGTSYTVKVNNAFSVAGQYFWQAYVTKGSERYLVDNGTILVDPNFAVQPNAVYDGRSVAKKRLDALETTIDSIVTNKFTTVSVDGVSYSRANLTELYTIRDAVRREYAAEQRKEQIANGNVSNTIYVRLGSGNASPGYPFWPSP